ncbi:MAG: SIMPL domain-containing protein [Muribaculaceae bacterium]|nr:SIMPL domain-containing protein [Muribaculaceae bacterium]
MKNSWTIEAIILAVAVIILGFFIKGGIDNFADKGRMVSVKGLAEVEVPANKVTWPIVFKEVGNDLPALYRGINSTTKSILDYLKSNGISDKEISVNAPLVIDLQSDRYSDGKAIYRYNIKSIITVTSSQVDKIRSLIASQGELLKDGIAIVEGGYENPIQYNFTSFNDIKPKMIEEATKNARLAAEQFAKDSDSELGKIIHANQGQFTIEDRDANTPYIKHIRVVTSIDYALKD